MDVYTQATPLITFLSERDANREHALARLVALRCVHIQHRLQYF